MFQEVFFLDVPLFSMVNSEALFGPQTSAPLLFGAFQRYLEPFKQHVCAWALDTSLYLCCKNIPRVQEAAATQNTEGLKDQSSHNVNYILHTCVEVLAYSEIKTLMKP